MDHNVERFEKWQAQQARHPRVTAWTPGKQRQNYELLPGERVKTNLLAKASGVGERRAAIRP